MTEQRERMEKALHRCAERGCPKGVDLWPGIRERAEAGRNHSPRRVRLLPVSRLSWAFAILTTLLVTTGGTYAASELIDRMFLEELPGARGTDTGVDLDQRQTDDNVAVVLEWAYADANSVVIGYSIEDLEDERRFAGHPVDLVPGKDIELTDGSGENLRVADSQREGLEGPGSAPSGKPKANTLVFEAPEKIDPGKQRFRLELPVAGVILGPEESELELVAEPFVFDFEATVQPVPVVEIDQKAEMNGLALTLDRVENSPGRPQAVICFDPPDDGLVWTPVVPLEYSRELPPVPTPVEDGCHNITLPDRSSSYSLTVVELLGMPSIEGSGEEKRISGPWKFDFEVPES